MIMEVLRAVGRRWYVVLVGIAVTVGLTYGAMRVSPPEYNARALILLLPGSNAVAEGGNPFLALSGLEQPGSIVVAYFASAAAKDEVASLSGSAQFDIALDSSTRGPVIAVEVTDTSTESTMSVLGFLMERVPAELARLQSELNAPSESIITSMPIVVDTKPELDASGTTRLGIAAAAVGLAATALSAFALDGFILRRRARRGDDAPTAAHRGKRHGGRHTRASETAPIGDLRDDANAAIGNLPDDASAEIDALPDDPHAGIDDLDPLVAPDYPEPVRAGRAG